MNVHLKCLTELLQFSKGLVLIQKKRLMEEKNIKNTKRYSINFITKQKTACLYTFKTNEHGYTPEINDGKHDD